MIVIYGSPRSRSTRALWAAEEAEIPYEFKSVDFATGAHRSPEYLALHPGGKVPTLVQDDFVLRESGAIVTWIGEQAPEKGLVPVAGSREHAQYLQWMCFVLSELEQPLWTVAKHTFALPAKYRIEAIKPVAFKEFDWAAAVLAKGLAGREYLVGDRFTMVDLLAGHTLTWATRALKIELEDEGVRAYAQRVLSRPALRRAVDREKGAPVLQHP